MPKGLADANENPRDAACRECLEETGLDLRNVSNKFFDCGVHPYTTKKDLYLFVYFSPTVVDPSTLHCSSQVFISENASFPECDQFKIVSLNEAEPLLNKKTIFSVESCITETCMNATSVS